MKIDPFYIENNLRVIEIPRGLKCPVESGWPNCNKPYGEVEACLDGTHFNKYGWILDDNHVVVDIDLHHEDQNGYKSLERLESDLGFKIADACGAVVQSPSGGCHYYFTKPPNAKFGKVFADRYPGIDFIAGKGKQVIAAGSAHDTYPGAFYELSENPSLLEIPHGLIRHLQSIRDKRITVEVTADRSGDEFNKSERGLALLVDEMMARGYQVRRAAGYYEFDRPGKTTDSKCSGHVGKVSKQGNYQLVCFSLSDTVFPSGEAMTIFHAYSLVKYGGDHKAAAMGLYDLGFAVDEYLDINLSRMAAVLAPIAKEELEDEAFAEMMVPNDGLIRLVYDHYSKIAHRKSCVMGLAVALSLCETIFGRRICSHTDLRTNDYNVIIAPTNCGKEACEKTITQILESADVNQTMVLPPDIQSGNGLMTALAIAKCGIWLGDEFGKVLSEILDEKQRASHRREIATHLLKLYGKADSTYAGAAHSAGVKNRIVQPHLCVLGLTTGSTLFTAMGAKNVSDGLFGRIAFWPVQDRPARRKMVKTPVPDTLKEIVGNWIRWTPSGNLGAEYPDPAMVTMTPEAEARWDTHSSQIDERMEQEPETRAGVWGRVAARTMKLALVHRAARIIDDPAIVAWDFIEIEKEDVDWAIRLSNWLAHIACQLIAQNFIDQGSIQARTAIVEAARANGGEIGKRELQRANRALTSGEISAAASILANQGTIEVIEHKGSGRPKVVYKLVPQMVA